MPLDDVTKMLASVALGVAAVVCPPAAVVATVAIGTAAAGDLVTAAVNKDQKKLEDGLEKLEILAGAHPSQSAGEIGKLAGNLTNYHTKK